MGTALEGGEGEDLKQRVRGVGGRGEGVRCSKMSCLVRRFD